MRWDNGCGPNVIYGENIVRKIEVATVCHGGKEEWASRRQAADFFLTAMAATEGCETERYANIYTEILIGFPLCTDE